MTASNPAYSSLSGVLFDKAQATLFQFPGGLGGSYTIPNSVTSIGDGAFEDCYSLTAVTIPNSVTYIGYDAFESCNMTSVTIPNSATYIGDGAFEQCGNMMSVTIGNGVTNIGEYAFDQCTSLTSVTIPGGVSSISIDVFAGCNSLTNITVAATNSVYSSLSGVLFDKAQATLLQFPGALGGSYTIPNSVTSIGYSAFAGCNITNITIPNGVTNIGYNAFGGCLMKSVVIPNSVTSIGEYAFGNCGMTSVTIPNSVTYIGDDAFFFCSVLKSAYFQGNAPPDDGTVFYSDPAIVYYFFGTTGWGSTFGSRPTVLWNPKVQANGLSFGVRTNRFGFNITGSSNLVIVVEGSTNLLSWSPVSTNTLNTFIGTNGTSYFSDSKWTNYPSRFYRIRSQ